MLLFAVAYLYIKENGKETKNKVVQLLKHGWLTGFLFYLALILVSTIFVRGVQTPYRNLLGRFGLQENTEWNFEILMNILMFIPFTFLYLKAFNPLKPWKSSLILSTITSFLIELSQLLFWLGECQMSDIVHNIIGGVIGCALYSAVKNRIRIRIVEWVRGIFIKGNRRNEKTL